jgi:spore coat polysaccharide biosynthesis protein SpsF
LGADIKKVVTLIQARVKSTRLPQKVLLPVEDRLLIEHVIDRLKRTRVPDEILICTSTHPDDRVLIEIAGRNKIGWFAGSEEDVLERFIQAAGQTRADVVVRTTGENPLVDPYYLDRAVLEHLEHGAEYTTIEGLPDGVRAEVIDVPALKKAHQMADNPTKSEYMTLYFREDFFKVHIIEAEAGLRRPQYRLTVDNPQDIELMCEIYKVLYRPGEIIQLEEVIRLLDNHPELVAINSQIMPRKVRREVLRNGPPKIKIFED